MMPRTVQRQVKAMMTYHIPHQLHSRCLAISSVHGTHAIFVRRVAL